MLIDQALAVALRHHKAGQLQQAQAIYRQVLAQDPNHAGALSRLGVIAHQTGEHDAAIDLIGRAIALQPRLADAHNNLGLALKAKGRLDEAVASFQQAVALKPDSPEPHNNLGNALQEKNQLDAAMASFRRALALKSDLPETHNNLGNVLREMSQFDEAIASYQRALALKSDYPRALNNLGAVLWEKGQLDEAMACYWRALKIKPDYAEAHNNLGMCLLTFGDFENGWREYEWRWQTEWFRPIRRKFPIPRWDGSELSGRRILLHAEQGFGDTLQFIRYLKLVAQRGGRIILECPPELFRLLHNFPHVEQLFIRSQTLPDCDVHCPLLSLPVVLHTTPESIPACVPYLCAEPSLASAWRSRLSATGGRLKVGLVWQGRVQRTLLPQALAPLAEIPNIWFCSLQKETANLKSPMPPRLTLADWTGELRNFADTAALITNLDLVITVDTAVAHLAGALGKPVWVLLRYAADWRWLLHRTDSPWYPTMRLFRQPAFMNWDGAINAVAQELSRWIARIK